MSDSTNNNFDLGALKGGSPSSGQSSSVASGISNPFGYPSSVDPNNAAALMLSNAAATIVAVAAQAMNQTAGSSQSSASSLQSSLLSALQGNHNKLIPQMPATPSLSTQANTSQAALLAALAAAGQSTSMSSTTASLSGNDAMSTLFRSCGTVSRPPAVKSLTSPTLLATMSTWSLQQLEKHVALLQQQNQQVPQSVALFLAEAHRKEKKKNAKRVANRKSASTSRARKKALVEEMTKTNARLKRQALILSLLPDLVMTTTPQGEITFCSAQVERILHFKPEDLEGAKLYELVVPSSREALKGLIEELTHPGKAKAVRTSALAKSRRGSKRRLPNQRSSQIDNRTDENSNENSNASARESAGSGEPPAGAAVVSEQSFPMSVVEVESKQRAQNPRARAAHENSDLANNNGASGEDDAGEAVSDQKGLESKKRLKLDDSSSLSSDAKNARAGDNLDRNVRWHNERMLKEAFQASLNDGPKDDVNGASVTANNAGARLSSLKHVPGKIKKVDKKSVYENSGDQSSSDDSLLAGVEEKKKGESTSDDSGYRESNDSREETSSSGSETSQSNDLRKKTFAPTIRLCLIRNDLTTIWCEVTSSIRYRSSEEDAIEEIPGNVQSTGSSHTASSKLEDQELLLCLRPIRDGDKTVDESLRFCPSTLNNGTPSAVQSSQNVMSSSSINSDNALPKRPPKKRALPASSLQTFSTAEESPSKMGKAPNPNSTDTEKSVVESLMLMNKFSP